MGLLPCVAQPGKAVQAGVFTFRSYGVEDGLGTLAVYAIAQDAQGFLWAGTEDGLYRYDGHRFSEVRQGVASPVWDIAASSDGALWAGTDDGIYQLKGNALVAVEGLPRQRFTFLALGGGGGALVAAGTQVLGRGGPGPWTVLRTLPGQVACGWASPDLRSSCLGTEAEVWRREEGNWTSEPLPRGFHSTDYRIFRDSKGRLYLRNRAELWRQDVWGGAWTDLSRRLPGNILNVQPPVEDQLGRIWVGTSQGLVCFDGDESWVLGESKGLPGGWANRLFVDREGSLWAASEGLQKLKGRFQWTNFGIHQGLPSPIVFDIGYAFSGRVFACTDHGVAELKGETWSVLPGTQGRTLLSGGGNGRDSTWFAGTGKDEPFNVVFRLDLATNRLEKISVEPCLTNDLILAIVTDEDGIYFGTRSQGVFRLRRDGGRWRTEPMPFPHRRAVQRVNALRKDPAGHLLAACDDGLHILDGGRWVHLTAADGLLGSNCGSLARDAAGAIWVSFLDARGISRVGLEGGKWKATSTLVAPERLFKDSIFSMAFDSRNVLWLGTSGGMKRWDGTSLQVFDRGNGLVSLDPSANGISMEPDGGVWQGFSNGIAHYRPLGSTQAPAAPRARILRAETGAGELDLGKASPRIPFKDRTLTFQFSALSFLNESQVVHEVRLLGLENEWRETRLYEARYPALPPGHYQFEVRSRFLGGPRGPVTTYGIDVLPPWWGTWWFRSLSGLTVLGAVLLAIQRRISALRRRNQDLEKMVAARTEALEASKRDLERANQALEQATLVDPLTGLHNRRFLDLSLPMDALQAQRTCRELVDAGEDLLEMKEDILIFLMDIDHFKTVNDTHGHLAGDQLLKDLALVLKGSTRATDSLVRWGGEEFLLVARRTRRAGAPVIADTLLEAIRNHVFRLPEGIEFHKTWSIGFTALPMHPRAPELGDWQQALMVADQCLYAAKNTGRDRWVGALVNPEADPARLEGMHHVDVGWALAQGLMDVASSAPDFQWPDLLRGS